MAGKTANWKPGPTVCRCCLAEGCYKDISTEYFWMGKREVYAEMLTNTFNVSIAFSQSGGPNSNSRLICEPCISRLRDASNFKRQVLDCEKTFMQHLDPGSSLSHQDLPEELAGLDDAVKVERVKIERDAPSDDDFDATPDFLDDDDDELDQPLTNFATKEPKKEAVSLLEELLDNPAVTIKKKSVVKTKQPPAKKVKRTETAKPTSSKVVAKTATAEKKKKGSGTLPPGTLLKFHPELTEKRRFFDARHNAAIVLESSNVIPFRWRSDKFMCPYCPFTSAEFEPHRKHYSQHSGDKLKALNGTKKNLLKVEVTDLKCNICNVKMDTVESLSEHLLDDHKKPIDKKYNLGLIPYRIGGDTYFCPQCDVSYKQFSKVNKHMNEHYAHLICPVCGKPFFAATRMKAHMIQHENKKAEAKIYKCSQCDEKFYTKREKYTHQQKHSTGRSKCPYCNEYFKSYPDRVKHLKTVHGKVNEYKCHLCTAVFLLQNARTRHIAQVHIKDKKFPCEECTLSFITAGQLKKHMVKHTGERNYVCSVCKKAYARPFTLREHMRIHTNDRRFACEHCAQTFIQKCSLKGHMKTHHPHADPLP